MSVPGLGYVGVGVVKQQMHPVDSFMAADDTGYYVPIVSGGRRRP